MDYMGLCTNRNSYLLSKLERKEITLHYITNFNVATGLCKNRKVHREKLKQNRRIGLPKQKCFKFSTEMRKCVTRNNSAGRLFHNRAPAVANVRSPTVAPYDWQTSS